MFQSTDKSLLLNEDSHMVLLYLLNLLIFKLFLKSVRNIANYAAFLQVAFKGKTVNNIGKPTIHNFKFGFDCGILLLGRFADCNKTWMANQYEWKFQ